VLAVVCFTANNSARSADLAKACVLQSVILVLMGFVYFFTTCYVVDADWLIAFLRKRVPVSQSLFCFRRASFIFRMMEIRLAHQ